MSSVASESRKHAASRPETAIAERRVRLVIEEQLQVEAVLGEKIAANFDDAEVEEIVLERSADQKFERQVVELLGVAAIESRPRREHLFDQHVAHHQRGRAIPVGLRQLDPPLGQREAHVMVDQRIEQVPVYFGKRRNGHHSREPES